MRSSHLLLTLGFLHIVADGFPTVFDTDGLEFGDGIRTSNSPQMESETGFTQRLRCPIVVDNSALDPHEAFGEADDFGQ